MPKIFYGTFALKIHMVTNRISILGCGWLGFPLAISLINKGWLVKGSTTSADKLNLLSSNGIDPYLVHLQQILSTKEDKFWNSEVLLINVPPSLRRQTADDYQTQMHNLLTVVQSSSISKVIFISSTSVYPDLNLVITETGGVDHNSPLYQSEQLFALSSRFETTIIRFGGLIGPGRSPSRFFAGKKDIPNGQAPVNLIQLDDCIGIIQMVLDQQHFGQTYHAAYPSHPTRAQFYSAAARNAGLPEPQFIDELKDWKIIDASQLSYQWKTEIG